MGKSSDLDNFKFIPSLDWGDYKLVSVGESNVLILNSKELLSPCYLDNAEFYVRTNPATDKLEGEKLAQYFKNRFG